MTFNIQYSDELFRLVIVGPEEDYLEAVPYCSVSSVVGPPNDGKVYGVYLTGSEPELDELSNHPTDIEMVSKLIHVYDLSTWPNLKPIEASVTLVETDFDEEEGDEEDEGDDLDDFEVKPA